MDVGLSCDPRTRGLQIEEDNLDDLGAKPPKSNISNRPAISRVLCETVRSCAIYWIYLKDLTKSWIALGKAKNSFL